jgi:hypothetical protein
MYLSLKETKGLKRASFKASPRIFLPILTLWFPKIMFTYISCLRLIHKYMH